MARGHEIERRATPGLRHIGAVVMAGVQGRAMPPSGARRPTARFNASSANQYCRWPSDRAEMGRRGAAARWRSRCNRGTPRISRASPKDRAGHRVVARNFSVGVRIRKTSAAAFLGCRLGRGSSAVRRFEETHRQMPHARFGRADSFNWPPPPAGLDRTMRWAETPTRFAERHASVMRRAAQRGD